MSWRNIETLSFLDSLPIAQSAADVAVELARAVPHFGMSYYFLGGMVPPGHPLLPGFKLHNWPGDLIEAMGQSDLVCHSPAPRITAISARTTTLTEYRSGQFGPRPDPAAEAFFDLLATHRMTHALYVPIHGPRGPRGFASFSGTGPDPEPRARSLLGLMAHLAFLRLSDLEIARQRQSGGENSLTEREIAMLRALAGGADDAGIAAQHHISVRTVRFHLSNAKGKLGARSRGEALILAAKGGFLSE